MKAAVNLDNKPLYNYTLMPGGFFLFPINILKTMEIAPKFSFTKDCNLIRFDAFTQYNEGSYKYGDLLFDNQTDPKQQNPINDKVIIAEMQAKMVKLMKDNDCPKEQFERVGM